MELIKKKRKKEEALEEEKGQKEKCHHTIPSNHRNGTSRGPKLAKPLSPPHLYTKFPPSQRLAPNIKSQNSIIKEYPPSQAVTTIQILFPYPFCIYNLFPGTNTKRTTRAASINIVTLKTMTARLLSSFRT